MTTTQTTKNVLLFMMKCNHILICIPKHLILCLAYFFSVSFRMGYNLNFICWLCTDNNNECTHRKIESWKTSSKEDITHERAFMRRKLILILCYAVVVIVQTKQWIVFELQKLQYVSSMPSTRIKKRNEKYN